MHHRKIGRKLNRNSSHRKAMFKNMAKSLIIHECIKTTLFKAKELQRIIDPIIKLSKLDSISNRRLVFKFIHDKFIINKLFNHIGPRFSNRNSGYTRVLKCGFRTGDNASLAYIELLLK